jgi:hypothetical protein
VGVVELFREALGLLHVGLGRLAPHEVAVRRVGDAAGDRLLDAGVGLEEALARALAE